MKKNLFIIVWTTLLLTLACGDPKAEYTDLLHDVAERNAELLQSYRNADNESQQKVVVNKARNYISQLLGSHLSSHWYGTQLSADGQTEFPRESSTSAVNFVVTVLRDCKFNVDRTALLQQTPEAVIAALTAETNIHRFEHEELYAFIDRLHEWGSGVYLLATDSSFGFLVVNACGIRYIYPSESGVKNEDAALCKAVQQTNKRVLGEFIESDWSVRKWLAGDAFGTKTTNPTTQPNNNEL